MLSHSYMFSSQNAIQEEEEGDEETEDEGQRQQSPEETELKMNELDMKETTEESHPISPDSLSGEQRQEQVSEDQPFNPEENDHPTADGSLERDDEMQNHLPDATNDSIDDDSSEDMDGEVEVFIQQTLENQGIVDNMADFEESEDEYPPVPLDPIISSPTRSDDGLDPYDDNKPTTRNLGGASNPSSQPSPFQQQLRQRTVFRQGRRASTEKNSEKIRQAHTSSTTDTHNSPVQPPPFSDSSNNHISLPRRGSLGFNRSPGSMVSGGALERESASGNLAIDALAAVKFDVEMSANQNADERPPSPGAEERIRKTRPLAVRIFLEGDGR